MRIPPMISPITRAWPTLSASQPQETVINKMIAIWVRSRPTPNLSVFSGTRASGARTAMPMPATSTSAAAAPAAASGMLPCVLPKVSTMNATSSPSSRTPLKATVKLIQSMPEAATAGSSWRAATDAA